MTATKAKPMRRPATGLRVERLIAQVNHATYGHAAIDAEPYKVAR
jgi:hypothetical protein